jgi:hypothetical protein
MSFTNNGEMTLCASQCAVWIPVVGLRCCAAAFLIFSLCLPSAQSHKFEISKWTGGTRTGGPLLQARLRESMIGIEKFWLGWQDTPYDEICF